MAGMSPLFCNGNTGYGYLLVIYHILIKNLYKLHISTRV